MADQNHKISQETFDETLLENQELFELSPEDAIVETISQFKQQGIQNIESYIITSHPDSDIGKQERQTRKDFEQHLNLLDSFIKEDGTVNLEGTSGGESLETASSKILNAIECVSNYCEGTFEDSGDSIKSATKCEKALPFLTLFHSSNSVYTFMSFLMIISVPEAQTSPSPTNEQILILNEICKFLTAIMTPRRSSERQLKTLIKDKFVTMERILLLILFFVARMKENDSSRMEASETLLNLVRLACAACRNSEKNKVAFVRALKNSKQNFDNMNTVALLVQVLSISIEVYKDDSLERNVYLVSLMTELMTLVAVLCRYDDFRPDGTGGGLGIESSYGMNVSSAHDHVMEFHRNGVVPLLHEISLLALITKENSTNQHATQSNGMLVTEEAMVSLAGAALSATRAIAVNDDIVQALVAVGVLKVVNMALMMGVAKVDGEDTDSDQAQVLKTYKQQLTVSAIGLVRNLCGNDEIKTNLCLGTPSDPSSSSLHMVLEGMRLYRDNAAIQEHGLGTMAAMALRKPANALRIVQENGPREIVAAMGKFPNNVLVQRQGALAVRNIVSRLVANHSICVTHGSGNLDAANEADIDNVNVRDVFLDLGTEIVLRQITGRHQGSVDEAYAALRDLGCEVSMLKYDTETNTVTSKTQMFGEVKSNFRAVYDESDDVQNKIAGVAEGSY